MHNATAPLKAEQRILRMAINDLDFTYRHLGRRLHVLALRSPMPLGTLLVDQQQRDATILESLVAESRRIGQTPGTRLCEQERAVIDDLLSAGLGKLEADRMLAIIGALQRVRALLARSWNRLLCTLPAGTMPEFYAAAMRAQQQVVQQYHDLGALARHLRND